MIVSLVHVIKNVHGQIFGVEIKGVLVPNILSMESWLPDKLHLGPLRSSVNDLIWIQV